MWFGGGFDESLDKMLGWATEDGVLLVGHPYWTEDPPARAVEIFDPERTELRTLLDTLDRFEQHGLELVELVLADGNSWDRYEGAHWWTVHAWLRANPNHPDHETMQELQRLWQRRYLEFGRRYLGWGVFVLRRGVRARTGVDH